MAVLALIFALGLSVLGSYALKLRKQLEDARQIRAALEADTAAKDVALAAAENRALSAEKLAEKINARAGRKVASENPEAMSEGFAMGETLAVEKAFVAEADACLEKLPDLTKKMGECVVSLGDCHNDKQALRASKSKWKAVAIASVVLAGGATYLAARGR